MGDPTSEVGYTPAMPRREYHEVHEGHVVTLGKKILLLLLLLLIMLTDGGNAANEAKSSRFGLRTKKRKENRFHQADTEISCRATR